MPHASKITWNQQDSWRRVRREGDEDIQKTV
jgi:hypothetical protein